MCVLGEHNLKAFMPRCKRHLNACIRVSVQGELMYLMALCYKLLLKHVKGKRGHSFHVKINSIGDPPILFLFFFGS